ncbi:helix-turn-helix domain-containing protein [Actinocorallia sp. B10E7]|uniref:helix-turn-helix domain-containing protein n=1 Tax=Actinocorallia sp. B10E7 TaxID=3153558 RepID=UPI00325D7911
MRKVDVVLHPIRLRIVQAFLGSGTLTTRQLAERLPDVPQATLYRHLGTLAENGILVVERENRVRGAIERVYSLPADSASLTGADLEGATPEEHLRYFATFLAALQGEFTRYLSLPETDLVADGVGYRTFALNLTDEEFTAFMAELGEVVARAAANPPAPGRRRRAFARITMPLEGREDP